MTINVLLFEQFEPLDVFGPVEVLGHFPDLTLQYLSPKGGLIQSHYGATVMTQKLDCARLEGALLIPGGPGTRQLVQDKAFLTMLKEAAERTEICLCVCTGSALLAACGCLEGAAATSNKKAFVWAGSFGKNIDWKKQARWVRDKNIYTSSGVSAGMDMALAFGADCYGKQAAEEVARKIEYIWNDDPDNDPFCRPE